MPRTDGHDTQVLPFILFTGSRLSVFVHVMINLPQMTDIYDYVSADVLRIPAKLYFNINARNYDDVSVHALFPGKYRLQQ